MFKYVSVVSILSHNIIKEYVKNKNVAIDATLGNGYMHLKSKKKLVKNT